jgi:hypothetical protein
MNGVVLQERASAPVTRSPRSNFVGFPGYVSTHRPEDTSNQRLFRTGTPIQNSSAYEQRDLSSEDHRKQQIELHPEIVTKERAKTKEIPHKRLVSSCLILHPFILHKQSNKRAWTYYAKATTISTEPS